MSRLIDYCLNITDGEHGTVTDDPCGEYYLLSNKNIIDGKIVITDADRRINKATFDKLNKRTDLHKGCVLIATVGTIGKSMVVVDEPKYTVQRSVGIITPNPDVLDPDFLKFYLDSPIMQTRIAHATKGAIQKCLFIDDIKELEVDIPDMPAQKEIVAKLKPLNDKISLNNSICADLEAMAKQIYDYWFVQFDFPDVNGNPYKSSGGKMVWCEELNREIPEGWSILTVDDISQRVKVGFVGTVDKYYCDESQGYPIVRPAEMSEEGIDYSSLRYITKEFYLKNKKSQVHKGDILISRCGKDGIPNIYNSDKEAQVLNAVIIEPDEEKADSVFIKEMLKSDYSQVQIMYGTSGSVQGVINTEMIAKIKLFYRQEVVKAYSGIVKKYYSMINNVKFENIQLTELRDFILPMLMNGQIKIGA
ncbi:restriction endonuclease subunit S [Butyrivibrio sp. AC2005]|uniref:restriction endonuclease subunit S n=1 Tax=Butyrivibrio sp. AC2005 TaxID=1280672 RepID=UPI0003FB4D00|nr:restriction endonuclease subunit S [Butyrivibrio sp. AC2005]